MARMLWSWTARDPMSRFRSAVDRLFETYGEGEPPGRGFREAEAVPRMAVSDVGDRYVLEAEVPGVRMEDLEITCIDRTVSIRGDRPDLDGSGVSYERRERPVGAFLRSFEFPEEVDAAKAEATLEEGILKITVPKAERAGPRQIEIRPSARPAETPAPAKAEEPSPKMEGK